MQLEMVSRDCPICGSADKSHVFAEADFDAARWDAFAFASRKVPEYMHYRLVACPRCDLLYADPLPTLDTLAAAYREAAYDSAEEARYAARTYARCLSPFLQQLPDRCGALDIGAGDGAFLEQLLRCGFSDVVGVEPSAAPIAAATEEIRPLLRQGLFRAQDFECGRFRLITCFQTVEHLYDPLAMCREAYALLRKESAFCCICHDRRAFSARLLGERSPIFDIEHLQLFSPRSVRFLLEQAGFVDVQIKVVVNRYPLRYWLKLFPLPAAFKRRLLTVLQKNRLGALPLAIPAGNLAAIGWKREAA
jgi:SAM-dependent methyltransferase